MSNLRTSARLFIATTVFAVSIFAAAHKAKALDYTQSPINFSGGESASEYDSGIQATIAEGQTDKGYIWQVGPFVHYGDTVTTNFDSHSNAMLDTSQDNFQTGISFTIHFH